MQNLPELIKDTAKLIREAHRRLPGPEFVREFCLLLDRIFPDGHAATFENITTGDPAAIEFGLIFVEVKPYFFRSQYIRTHLIRRLKQASLNSSQAERLQCILELEHQKKMLRPKGLINYKPRELRKPFTT